MSLLKELIPMFRTETCGFIEEEGALVCLGRLEDLDKDEEYDVSIDVSSLCWLFLRVFPSPKMETMKEFNKDE